MGCPIDTHNTIVKIADVAKIQNTKQQWEETQRRQFALALQQEAARKETQVQTTPKSKSPEIHREKQNKEKHRKKQKRSHEELSEEACEQEESDDEEHHIDLKIG
jgi:hypothetical protein